MTDPGTAPKKGSSRRGGTRSCFHGFAEGIVAGGLFNSRYANRAVRRGATFNGLAILNEAPDLNRYYAAHVAGGSGAFVMSVATFDGFAEAMRRKLAREIGCPKIARQGM